MRWGDALILGLGVLVLYGAGLGARDFWAPDEPEYALVAREMIERVDLVVPYRNGEPFAEKPPLFYWSIIAAWKVTGQEGLGRLPSALSGVLGVLLTYFLGCRLAGRGAGLAAAAILGTTVLWIWQARYLQVDMVLAVATAASIVTLHAFQEKGWRWWPLALGGVAALAAAVLTKGPVALVVVGLWWGAQTLLDTLAGDRGRGLLCAGFARLREHGAVRAAVPVLLLAALVPWWLWLDAVRQTGEGAFLAENVGRQNWTRFWDAWSHNRPPWYYLWNLPIGLLPWAVLLPGAIVGFQRGGWRERAGRLILAWFVPAFLFFSVCSSKNPKYLIPLYPAIALGLGITLVRLERRWPLMAAGGVLGTAGIAMALAAVLGVPERASAVAARALVPGVTALVGGLVALGAAVRRRRSLAAGAVAVTMAAVALIAALTVAPALDRHKSARPFCEEVVSHVGPEAPIVLYGPYRAAYTYYMHRVILRVEEKDVDGLELRLEETPGAVVLMRAKHYRKLPPTVRGRLEEIVRRDVGSKEMRAYRTDR